MCPERCHRRRKQYNHTAAHTTATENTESAATRLQHELLQAAAAGGRAEANTARAIENSDNTPMRPQQEPHQTVAAVSQAKEDTAQALRRNDELEELVVAPIRDAQAVPTEALAAQATVNLAKQVRAITD